MVDVVDGADASPQLQQVRDGVDEVLVVQRPLVAIARIGLVVQLDIELHPADAREVVLPGIEEHPLEELGRGIRRRRIARAQLFIDLQQRIDLRLHRIFLEGGRDDVARFVVSAKKSSNTECRLR